MADDSESRRSHSRGHHGGRGRGCGGGGMRGEHFERFREAMADNREIFDRNLTKLTPEAQKHAIQIREVFEDRSKDGETVREEIHAIKAGLSQDIRDELDDHKHRMMREMHRERGEECGGEGHRSRSRPRRRGTD